MFIRKYISTIIFLSLNLVLVGCKPAGAPPVDIATVGESTEIEDDVGPILASSGALVVLKNSAGNSGALLSTRGIGDITYEMNSEPIKGIVTITNPATGAYTYEPNENSTGLDLFTFSATDSGYGLVSIATITITINDSNTAPTDIELSVSSVLENLANTSVVAALTAMDIDAGDTAAYSMVEDAAGRFSISGSDLVVSDSANLDFESTTSHSITIRVTDSNGAFYDKDFVIAVTDVDETIRDSALSLTTIAENSATDTKVADISRRIPGLNENFTYSLINDSDGAFKIIGTELLVADVTKLNFEVAPSHSITLRATETGGLISDDIFTITIADVDDLPVFASHTLTVNVGPDEFNSSAFTLPAITDEDEDTIAYAVVGPPTRGTFTSLCDTVTATNTISPTDINCGYSPNSGQTEGTDTITIQIVDQTNGFIDTSTLVITVMIGTPIIADVAITTDNICLLMDSKKVRCWGKNLRGGLGYANGAGATSTTTLPPPVDLGVGLKTIGMGQDYQCGITVDDQVKCWGYGSVGRTGAGSTYTIGDNEHPSITGIVDLDASANTVIDLSVGYTHSCAVMTNGDVRCWGINTYGQLGVGSSGNSNRIGDDELPSSVAAVTLPHPAIKVTAGPHSTCAILNDGSAYCWGLGDYGSMGNGAQTLINANPVAVTLGTHLLKEISSNRYHTCAITREDKVLCWGNSFYGRTGLGVSSWQVNHTVPTEVDLPVDHVPSKISTGLDHTIVLYTNGEVQTWGRGDEGQLGYPGVTGKGGSSSTLPSTYGTVDISSTATVAKIYSRWGPHNCVVLTDGKLNCWGKSQSGNFGRGGDYIGDNETLADVTATPINGAILDIALGYNRTVLVNNSTTVNTQLTCSGSGLSGACGHGSSTDLGEKTTSESNYVLIDDFETVTQISAGYGNSCALLSSGEVQCFGEGGYGGMGNYSNSDIGSASTTKPNAMGKVELGAGVLATYVTSGHYAACAITNESNNNVRCWGRNYYGSLGVGHQDRNGSAAVYPITPVNLGEAVVTKLSQRYYTVCALTTATTNNIICWGYANFGQLGNGSTERIGDDENPTAYADLGGDQASEVSVGWSHTCAIMGGNNAGKVRCWGMGSDGQLGYGNYQKIITGNGGGYVDLGAGRLATKIASGKYFTCALLNNGTVKCWGKNYIGQLGQGNTTTIGLTDTPADHSPINFGPGGIATDIYVGYDHACAVLSDSSVKCWGSNANGKLGNASTLIIGDDETPNAAGNSLFF